MLLQHWTSPANWEQIRSSGALLLTNPMVHPSKPGRGVVWLTNRDTIDNPDDMGLGLDPVVKMLTDSDRIDKSRIRITVEVSKVYAHRWLEWAPKHGGHPGWVSHIRSSVRLCGTWWVHTRVIPREHWVAVHDVAQDVALSIAPTFESMGFRKLRA